MLSTKRGCDLGNGECRKRRSVEAAGAFPKKESGARLRRLRARAGRLTRHHPSRPWPGCRPDQEAPSPRAKRSRRCPSSSLPFR